VGPKDLVETKTGWIAHKGSALEYLVQASVMKRGICDEDTGSTSFTVYIVNVITTVTMSAVIWYVTPCSLVCTVA